MQFKKLQKLTTFLKRKKKQKKKKKGIFEKSDTENVLPVRTMAPHFAWQ